MFNWVQGLVNRHTNPLTGGRRSARRRPRHPLLLERLEDRTTPAAGLTATKAAALQTDNNANTLVDPGDTLRYTVTVSNPTGGAATGVTFSDTPDANTTVVG